MSIMQGMICNRRCESCGELLTVDDGALCAECRPRLSARARQANEIKRRWREDLELLERETEHLETVIRKVERRLQWRQRRQY